MTKDEMKLLKFKIMIEEIDDKIKNATSRFIEFQAENGEELHINGAGIFFEDRGDNPYLNMICNRPSSRKDWSCNIVMANIEGLISALKQCGNCGDKWNACSVLGTTIFYSLMALAVDEKLYNEKMEVVSDVAYMMGFNEEMMEDWTTVVKKFLLAEKIDSKLLKTEQAKKFFAFFDK